ncbi:YHS domain-containing protein [Marinobacterium sp. D7]|uniref:YHS domain-containing protein n=1 Tax=Marinobacterium ramblicola TaxID=2849041 RepID=UPI001C2D9774|nr:YHS domain-containing protein [Marinobacterium ramblicola]MBV1788080.1 YHS domain-containing protein [Marinobacterium ramblicola]
MDGFISLLVFAGLFYLMMRFGCGAHMIHGHHHRNGHSDHKQRESYKDPVCGMEVAPDQGYRKVHEGQEYRFCSRSCLDKFDADPGRYLRNTGEQS